MVEAQVAGKDHISVRSFYDNAHGVGYGVVYRKKAHADIAHFNRVVLFHLVDVEQFEVGELLLPFADHHGGKSPCIYGRVADPVDYVRYTADMVEMAVRDKEPAYLFAALLQILGVGDYVVDARCVVLAELESRVDDDNVVADLNHGHVFTYLLDPAERDDAYVAG